MKTLLIFDFDSTLVREESLVELLHQSLIHHHHHHHGGQQHSAAVHERLALIEKITDDGIRGEISMVESYGRRLGIARPTKQFVERYLERNMDDVVAEGMASLLSDLNERFTAQSLQIHVVSQGPSIIVQPICEDHLHIPRDRVHCVAMSLDANDCYVVCDNDHMLTRGKSAIARDLVADDVQQVIVVGDGVSDMQVSLDLRSELSERRVRVHGVGFGLYKQFQSTRDMSDYWIDESVDSQLRPLLFRLISDICGHGMLVSRNQVFNFSAGPSTLPTAVLEQASREGLLNYDDSGMSLAEMSHRSSTFESIMRETKSNLRQLLSIPENYEILFMQGGGSMQFSCVPMNLLTSDKNVANYIITGAWSKKAYEEGKAFSSSATDPLHINITADETDNGFTNISPESEWLSDPPAASSYTHYCDNETIHGVEFDFVPSGVSAGALVCDMSSNFLTKPVDVSKYGLIYAGAQKNIGIAGVTIVIIRKDLLDRETYSHRYIPKMMDYKVMADHNSLYNTPPTLSIYTCNLMFEWIKRNGGVRAMERQAIAKSSLIYNYIDSSKLYCNNVAKRFRSRVNVVCHIKPDKNRGEQEVKKLEREFIDEARNSGLVNIEGHRSVGGLRFSCYVAMRMEGVQRLIEFMREFEKKHCAP